MNLTSSRQFDTLQTSNLGRYDMRGGVYRQKGRKYWRVWVPWKGKKYYFSKYLDGFPIYDERQANRLLEKIRAEIDAGQFDPATWGKDQTVKIEEAWRVYQDQATCKKASLGNRDRMFEKYVLPYFNGWLLTDIEENHVRDCISKLPTTIQPSTKRNIVYLMKAFFKSHVVTRRKVFLYPVISCPKKTIRWLTQDEQRLVFHQVPVQHKPIIKFLMFYGCRVSEACNLKRADVDWGKREITLVERKNDEDNILPILAEIEAWLKGSASLHYVFSHNGKQYGRKLVWSVWKDAILKSGLPYLPLKNGTRHSVANQLASRGEETWVIARVLGNNELTVQRAYKGSASVKKVAEVLSLKQLPSVAHNG